MTIETPFRDFLAFWERAAERPAAEQAELWEELYGRRHRDVLDQYDRWFGAMGSLEAALPRYAAVAPELERRFAALELERAAAEVGGLFGVPGPGRIVAFVGFFTADAWFDEDADDAPTVFFALETDPPVWHRVIALHELGHAAHHEARSGTWHDLVPAIMLMAEGVATATSLHLAPEAPPERHFGVEDHAAWAQECRAAWPDAARELLAGVEEPDERLRRRFFWPDWGRDDHDVPERFGYFAAAEVLGTLLERHDLAALARWPAERAVAEVRSALATLA